MLWRDKIHLVNLELQVIGFDRWICDFNTREMCWLVLAIIIATDCFDFLTRCVNIFVGSAFYSNDPFRCTVFLNFWTFYCSLSIILNALLQSILSNADHSLCGSEKKYWYESAAGLWILCCLLCNINQCLVFVWGYFNNYIFLVNIHNCISMTIS